MHHYTSPTYQRISSTDSFRALKGSLGFSFHFLMNTSIQLSCKLLKSKTPLRDKQNVSPLIHLVVPFMGLCLCNGNALGFQRTQITTTTTTTHSILLNKTVIHQKAHDTLSLSVQECGWEAGGCKKRQIERPLHVPFCLGCYLPFAQEVQQIY